MDIVDVWIGSNWNLDRYEILLQRLIQSKPLPTLQQWPSSPITGVYLYICWTSAGFSVRRQVSLLCQKSYRCVANSADTNKRRLIWCTLFAQAKSNFEYLGWLRYNALTRILLSGRQNEDIFDFTFLKLKRGFLISLSFRVQTSRSNAQW